jgi:hypothetical protein
MGLHEKGFSYLCGIMKAKSKKTAQKEVANKEAKPKLTQRQINREIMKLSKEVNRNITMRTLKGLLEA